MAEAPAVVAPSDAPARAARAREIRFAVPEYAEPFLRPARYKSLRGGRGAAKSHFFAQLAIMRMTGCLPAYPPGPVRIASARDIESTIKESVKTLVEHYIVRLGLAAEFDVQAFAINHIPTGSHMFFPGIQKKVDAWLSIEGIDVLWVEQAEKLGMEMVKIDPSIRKPGAERWFSWNPLSRSSWCWQRFVVRPRPGDVSLHVTWEDNPWFDEEMDETRRAWQESDPDLYAWMYGGMPNDADGASTILSYEALLKCVDAHEKGLGKTAPGIRDAGLDIAEGGADKCALVVRQGPNVEMAHAWPGVAGDLSIAAHRAKDLTQADLPARIYYDASSPMRTDLLRAGFVGVRPVNFGGAVGGPSMLYEPRRPNKEVFARRNIQMAANLRLRVSRTVRLLNGDENTRPEQSLFINPKIRRLESFLTDLTQPTRRLNPITGRWEMDKRGGDENAQSPDLFDAVCMAFGRDTDGRGIKVR